MNECLPDSSYNALAHFINESAGDGISVMNELAHQVQATRAAVAGEKGLLLDECSWEKVGSESIGVSRQYIGRVGKISNEQAAYLPCSVGGTAAGLVGGRSGVAQ